MRSKRVIDPIENFLGAEIYPWHAKVLFKEAKGGGAQQWHQDYGYWYYSGCLYPAMASCFISVDPATIENGCLQVLRGSHKLGRADHIKPNDQEEVEESNLIEIKKRHQLIHCELEPGDAIFFHCNLLHYSDPNFFENTRWAFISCYNAKYNSPANNKSQLLPSVYAFDKVSDEKVFEVNYI